MKKINQIFNNLWVIGIGTAILSVIIMRVIDKIADTKILTNILNFTKYILSFFQQKYIVSFWFLILTAIVSVGVFIAFFYIKSIIENNTEEPIAVNLLNYKSDNFNGVLYKWNYIKNYDSKYLITDIKAYCPIDNCLIYNNECAICRKKYYNVKDNTQLEILIGHKIENNLYGD